MTKRDFFRILIKLFTLYAVIISVLTMIPQIAMYNQIMSNLEFSLIFLGSILFLFVFLMVMIKYTDKIIDFLQLEKGFDDEHIIIGNLTNVSIVKLAMILIGGFLIVDNLPNFIFDIFNLFKFEISNEYINNQIVDHFTIWFRFVEILFGYILIVSYKSIANFIDKK